MNIAYLNPQNRQKSEYRNVGKAKQSRLHVPDGEYLAMATDCKVLKMFAGMKAFIEFNIEGYDESPNEFNSVYLAIQMHEKYGPRSKLYKLWTLAHGRVPNKGEKISPKDLVGHIYQITTRTVTHDEHQKEHHDLMKYSVVDSIIALAVRNNRRK
ncbi:MAG: hypothetical protein KDD46_06510 [Bdellovibrionales bacterium]|nr:hypothetical protein [Bdellovibrionales bacterium]